MSSIRENWRIVLLVVLLLGSMVTLLVPGATAGGTGNQTAAADTEGITNLQYGIQLDGGSRIRAPVVGMTAEGIDVSPQEERALERNLSRELGLDLIDVEVRPQQGTAEVFNRSVSQSEFAQALRDLGYDVREADVSDGVTDQTRSKMVEVIDRKLQVSALSGANVRQARTPTGEHYVVVEATGRDIGELRDILSERGLVRLYAFYPQENGTYTRQQALTQTDIASVQNTRQQGPNQFAVGVTLQDQAVDQFVSVMRQGGFTQATSCQYNNENPQQSSGRCLLTTLNGEVVYSAGVRADLARSFGDGSFANDPQFVMTTGTREEARALELNLRAGQPLPAPLDFENAQTSSLQPALADRFKVNSAITGLLAVLAVTLVVYSRYKDVRVAAPMVVTALSEVVLLLGFVSVIQFPLDLSHIAGFIAVIGTGVDDLVIIADEILQQEGVTTGRVFQSRFRKAFWVIGAAAATTIIAMSPLMVLSLGDLTGFAIVTIIGVLIGVLVTRPAYGDILRHLVLEEDN